MVMRLFGTMARKRASEPATAALLRLAGRQHGVLARRQLAGIGVSDDELLARVAAGWLRRVHRGVYGVVASGLSWRGRWMAAVLACGEGAVLSHGSAAGLWRLCKPGPGDVEVIVPGTGSRRPRAGIRIHRSTTLAEDDRTARDGIPVTSPSRTIADLAAAGTSGRPLERLLDEAERLRLLDPAGLAGASGGRAIPASLRDALASHEPGSTLTRSELEERFLGLCRGRGLSRPLVNAELLGLTVDFLWPSAALVVEVDGRAGHATRRGFQDDRDRDSMLVAAGFRTMRFTWWDVTSRPQLVAHRLGRALAARPTGP